MKKETKKILSITLANWSQILLIVMGNLLLIPLILHSWSADLLGIWMILISVNQLIQILTFSHQSYIFNRAFILTSKKKFLINREIISAIPISIIILSTLILCLLLIDEHSISKILNIENNYSLNFKTGIIYLSISYLFTFAYSHFFSGIIAVKGYLHSLSWFKLLRSFLNLFIPAIAIYFGSNFIEAVYFLILSELISFIPLFIFVLNKLKKFSFKIYKFDISNGIKTFTKSLVIVLNNIVDFFKNIGLRLILASIFSPLYVSYFVTLRIISNFIKFSIDSFREPLFPQIMNSLKKNKKNNALNFIEIYWLISLFIFCPLLIAIQYTLPYVFQYWTLDKIQFQPELFSLLIMSLLFYSLYVPFDIILRGFNENIKILKISISTIFIFMVSFFILLKIFSFLSIGIAILLSEIFTLILYFIFIKNFLEIKKIKLNTNFFIFSNLYIVNTCIILFVIAINKLSILILLYFVLSFILLIYFINSISSKNTTIFAIKILKNILK